MPHELCDVAPRHRRGWHLLATHAEGLLECEGLLESPSSPRSSSYPAPKEPLGSAVLSQAWGSQGRLGSRREPRAGCSEFHVLSTSESPSIGCLSPLGGTSLLGACAWR